MEIYRASRQWAERPIDERFWNAREAAAAALEHRESAATSTVAYGDLRVEARGDDIALLGRTDAPATLTHYAFGQLAGRVKAPADYLRGLPPTLAAQNLNHGLKARGDKRDHAQLLLHRNGAMVARCLTSTGYTRIWNHEVLDRMVRLEQDSWRVPPARPAHKDPRTRPATEEDCGWCGKGGLEVRPGDPIAPAGVYASDRDMFVFMVHPERALRNPLDSGTPLMRGFFCWNSEVGDRSFGVMSFLLDAVCGNHIVWGAQDVKEIRVRHVGSARQKAFGQLRARLIAYSNESASEDEARIKAAQELVLGDDADAVLDCLLKWAAKRPVLKSTLSKGVIGEAQQIAARTPRYGDPRTPWAISQGITEISQRQRHASARVRMDDAAGKVAEMAF
jgi:hypothetical protein